MTKEIIHYLQHVERFWSTLVDGDRHQMAKIDIHTVEKLQLRTPAACSADTREVKGYIFSGEIFSQFGETSWHSNGLAGLGTCWDSGSVSTAFGSVSPSSST